MLDIGSNIKIDVDSKILSKSIESFINNDNSDHNPISEFRNEIKKLQKIVTNINDKDIILLFQPLKTTIVVKSIF